MVYKIKHEKKGILIVGLISLLLFYLFLFLNWGMSLSVALVCMAVAVVFAILYFVEQIVGTAVIIEDRMVIIKYFVGRKKIAVEEIAYLDIEKYKRYRRGNAMYTEYRMRMTINLLSGKKIVLTDKACAIKGVMGFLLSNYEEIPDEEVALYEAYLAIKQKCVKYKNWQSSDITI